MSKLVTFETAKLAKEKGFDWQCMISTNDGKNQFISYTNNKRIESNYFMLPTQPDLRDWIFENHQIWVNVTFIDTIGFCVEVLRVKENRSKGLFTKYESLSDTPQDLMEIGLQEALKRI